jgi:hypothetical protein
MMIYPHVKRKTAGLAPAVDVQIVKLLCRTNTFRRRNEYKVVGFQDRFHLFVPPFHKEF